ncbi:MAG: hypothetical protein Q7R50_01600 [Dehalococcoidales bacterium]|nr:hypothetical protein [Dehalococcoidales bacterium]
MKAGQRISLIFGEPEAAPGDYPTSRIQKGLLLVCGKERLSEEGLGFGVPLLKFGNRDIFPGSARLFFNNVIDGASTIEAVYELNLIKKMAMNGRHIKSRTIYGIETYFGRLHREYPVLRETVDRGGSQLRQLFGINSVFEKGVTAGNIGVTYTMPKRGSTIHVAVDLSDVKRDGLTEIIIANEQGANYFDGYCDANGKRLSGEKIGTWDEVIAEHASLIDSGNRVTFTLGKINMGRLFRGRELAPGRLAWAGLNYILLPNTAHFTYDIELGENT